MKKNILTLERLSCTGCRACEHICPKNCISFKPDYEGFIYPEVDETVCNECGLCLKRCPSFSDTKLPDYKQKFFGLRLKDKNALMKSSSGGAFAGLANYIIRQNGIVYGCAYTENLIPQHIAVNDIAGLEKLKGSKYVSSDTKDTFKTVKAELQEGKTILYSGLPCQIAGLKSFLNKEYENLYTVDLICHGVPSQKLFKKYLEWLGQKMDGKIIYYGFRDKEIGQNVRGLLNANAKTSTKIRTKNGFCDPYYASFLRCEIFRESCYKCKYANMYRIGDITIGDFWGIKKYYPDYDDSKGVSAIIINTAKGESLFNLASGKFDFFECKELEIRDVNTNLNVPSPRTEIRNTIYHGIDELSANHFFKKFKYSNAFVLKVKKKIRKLIPSKLKNIIKKLRTK